MNWDENTIREWNQLGFYYEYDKDIKQWRFLGSKVGLERFAVSIKSFSEDIVNSNISEHVHYGPYNYLKVMTWGEPCVTQDYIGGTQNDLLKLSHILTDKLALYSIGQAFVIKEEYSMTSTSSLLFIIMSDDFTPSFIEFNT
jgi:hypothetical protein